MKESILPIFVNIEVKEYITILKKNLYLCHETTSETGVKEMGV